MLVVEILVAVLVISPGVAEIDRAVAVDVQPVVDAEQRVVAVGVVIARLLPSRFTLLVLSVTAKLLPVMTLTFDTRLVALANAF